MDLFNLVPDSVTWNFLEEEDGSDVSCSIDGFASIGSASRSTRPDGEDGSGFLCSIDVFASIGSASRNTRPDGEDGGTSKKGCFTLLGRVSADAVVEQVTLAVAAVTMPERVIRF
jgi:hypothetical protein